jgi:hypothetical protein
MVKQKNGNDVRGSASRPVFHRTVLVIVAALLLCGGARAEAQFQSGSTGIHGVFPPPGEGGTVPNAFYIVWNMKTGGVRYCSSYTEGTGSDQCTAGSAINTFVQIPAIPAGGLTTGIYEFTDVQIVGPSGLGRRVVVVGTSSNVPLTILSQGDITFTSPGGNTITLAIHGQAAPTVNTNFAEAGARGGPAGFDGGASGNGGTNPGSGSAGFGPSGGVGGQADASTAAGLNGASATAPPLNYSLTPLTGGSGGGGAAGVSPTNALGCGTAALGYGGGAGGGGGGALLLAATGRVNLSSAGSILASGGNGGRNNQTPAACGLYGGGGGGGSVRIVAREFTGGGAINVNPGSRSDGTNPAVGGHVRIETNMNTYTGSIQGAAAGSFLAFPTASVPSNQPLLRITSIGGVAAPANPSASLSTPDITFPSDIVAPVTVAVSANNVPAGTPVAIKVVPATGQPTTATTGGLSDTGGTLTASASVTLPPGAGVVTASATFSIAGGSGGGGGGAFNTLPLIDGKPFERVEVAALADGTSRTYLVAQSGVRFELGTVTR